MSVATASRIGTRSRILLGARVACVSMLSEATATAFIHMQCSSLWDPKALVNFPLVPLPPAIPCCSPIS
eukprot:6047117-Alexandrium_andersonii.AAC.1